MILTLALLISCVPNQVYALAGEAPANLLEATDTAVLQPNATPDSVLSSAHIVAEDVSKRGESYKEYIMNNGLRYATVYPSAIHYEVDGQWKDIDNTLVPYTTKKPTGSALGFLKRLERENIKFAFIATPTSMGNSITRASPRPRKRNVNRLLPNSRAMQTGSRNPI